MNLQTNGNGHTKKIVAAVTGTLIATSLVAWVAWVVDYSGWRGGVDRVLAEQHSTSANVGTALKVLADHGAELEWVRQQLEGVRGEVSATRTELLSAMQLAAGDRFRGSDFEREKEIINIRFTRIDEKLDALGKQLEQLEQVK